MRLFLALSLTLNAFAALCWLKNEMSHPTIPQSVIRHGVGLAYCSPANANTQADFALIDAIACEVERESNTWLRRWWR